MPVKITKKLEELDKILSYEAREKFHKEARHLMTTLLVRQYGFHEATKPILTLKGRKAAQQIIKGLFLNPIRFNAGELGEYFVALQDCAIHKGDDKRPAVGVCVDVSKQYKTEDGKSVTNCLMPVYESNWGDTLLEIVENVTSTLTNAAVDAAFDARQELNED